MGKELFVSKRTALTEKQQKAMDYANAETMFYEGTTVCVPAQYAVDKEMKIKEKEGEKILEVKSYYAYILDINGNILETKYITHASLNKETLAKDTQVTVKVKEYNGRYWSELPCNETNWIGKRPKFDKDDEGFLYLAEPICFKVGRKHVHQTVQLAKNSSGEWEHKHKGEILDTKLRMLPDLTMIALIEEYTKLPAGYPAELVI